MQHAEKDALPSPPRLPMPQSTQSNEDPNALLHWKKLDSSFRHADQTGRVISEQEEKEGEKKEEENTTCNFLADTWLLSHHQDERLGVRDVEKRGACETVITTAELQSGVVSEFTIR